MLDLYGWSPSFALRVVVVITTVSFVLSCVGVSSYSLTFWRGAPGGRLDVESVVIGFLSCSTGRFYLILQVRFPFTSCSCSVAAVRAL